MAEALFVGNDQSPAIELSKAANSTANSAFNKASWQYVFSRTWYNAYHVTEQIPWDNIAQYALLKITCAYHISAISSSLGGGNWLVSMSNGGSSSGEYLISSTGWNYDNESHDWENTIIASGSGPNSSYLSIVASNTSSTHFGLYGKNGLYVNCYDQNLGTKRTCYASISIYGILKF